MNKMQIICPLVTIAIAAVVIAVVTANNNRRAYRYYASQQIGMDLIAQTNSDLLVQLDTGFHAKLSELLRAETSVASVQLGDEPRAAGVGKAHTRLILTNTAGQALNIRLRADSTSNRFQVLSFQPQ